MTEVDVEIDNIEDFIRLRPIKPTRSLMDTRRELLAKLHTLTNKEVYKTKDINKLMYLSNEIRNIEDKILRSK